MGCKSMLPLETFGTGWTHERGLARVFGKMLKPSLERTSNDIIAGNGRVPKSYMFIVWLYQRRHWKNLR